MVHFEDLRIRKLKHVFFKVVQGSLPQDRFLLGF